MSTKDYASMRVPNGRGGHDLTADGWDEMARLMREQLAATEACARLLRDKGREAVDFKAARRRWGDITQQMLKLSGAGELFTVATFSRTMH